MPEIPRLQDVPSADLVKMAEKESEKLMPRQQPKAYFKVLHQVTPLGIYMAAQSGSTIIKCFYANGSRWCSSWFSIDTLLIQFCILSTISFVLSLAKKYSMTPILNFDQPLYLKARNFQTSFNSNNHIHNCVLRLGSFHMCTSFIGAIEYLMKRSGISFDFEQIYASCYTKWNGDVFRNKSP